MAALLAELAADAEREAAFRAERDATRSEAGPSGPRDEFDDWDATIGDGLD